MAAGLAAPLGSIPPLPTADAARHDPAAVIVQTLLERSKIEACDPTNLRCAKYGQGTLVPHQLEPVESLANFREIDGISNAALRIRHGQVRVTA